jgi:hypothetical protein
MDNQILNSRQVMELLSICENTLLKLERDGILNVDFRIGNRKRYYQKNILLALSRKR